jgi:DNA-binding transcriptional MerR regulator
MSPPRDPAGGARADRHELCSIAEVQRETGLSARTLRYYEELGLLPGVRRRAGGRRVYGPDEIERVRFIQRLKRLGLSLAEIKELNAVYGIAGSTRAMLSRLDELLERHRLDVEKRIEELATLRGDIDRYRERVGGRITVLRAREESAGRPAREEDAGRPAREEHAG